MHPQKLWSTGQFLEIRSTIGGVLGPLGLRWPGGVGTENVEPSCPASEDERPDTTF